MKVYLADDEKIHIYSLPKKIEDSFLINYTNKSSLEEIINIIANNGKWMIQSTPEVSFYQNNKLIKGAYLENNSVFQVKFSDLENNLNLYCFETPISFVDYEVANKSEITVGNSNVSTILYNNSNVSACAISITNVQGSYLCKNCDLMQPVYINGYREDQKFLQYGDIIFIQGLKIIWFESFIKINIPKDPLSTNLPRHKKTNIVGNKYTEVTDSERASVLYADNQVFFHTPRLKETIINQEINIQLPPNKNSEQKIPVILQLGGSMMMGISSSITGVIAVFNIIKGKATLLSSITEVSVCLAMLLGSILFPILLDRYQKHLDKKREKKRQVKYHEYLKKKKDDITKYMEKEKNILLENNLSIQEIQNALTNRSNKIWSRELSDSDFLSLRLGIGDIKPHIKITANLEDFL